MKTSVFIDIAAELQAILANPPIPLVGQVARERQAPIGTQTPYAITVRLEKTQGSPAGVTGAPRDWATDYAVECAARADANTIATDVVDPLLRAVYERLALASTHAELLKLAVMEVLPDPAITWDSGDAQTQLIVVTLSVRVVHRTFFDRLDPYI